MTDSVEDDVLLCLTATHRLLSASHYTHSHCAQQRKRHRVHCRAVWLRRRRNRRVRPVGCLAAGHWSTSGSGYETKVVMYGRMLLSGRHH
jgi:hypothetical protein